MPHPSSRAHLRIRQTPLAPKRAYDHYGLVVYETEDGEYAVGTDLQVQKAAEMAIENDVWAFKASFIASVVGLSRTEEKAIEQMQRDMSEDAGPIIKRLIGGKMKQFIRDAIRSDGVGHFLSPYDGHEISSNLIPGLPKNKLAFRVN